MDCILWDSCFPIFILNFYNLAKEIIYTRVSQIRE